MKLPTAGLLLLKDRKLLLAFSNNKQCYYLPGGKIDEGETAAQALCREIAEELNVQLQPNDLQFYTHISATAYGEAKDVIMEQDCFFTSKEINPIAAAEIGALHYFTMQEYLQQTNTAPGAVMILQQLKEADYID
jgi:8-oxo-dGTP pyrophosphatase MutT (NUDIX family)